MLFLSFTCFDPKAALRGGRLERRGRVRSRRFWLGKMLLFPELNDEGEGELGALRRGEPGRTVARVAHASQAIGVPWWRPISAATNECPVTRCSLGGRSTFG